MTVWGFIGYREEDDGWTVVTKGCKPKLKQLVTVHTSNAFNLLYANNNPEKNTPQLQTNALPISDKRPSKQDNKQSTGYPQTTKRKQGTLFDECITQAKDKLTTLAKENNTNTYQIAIDKAHAKRNKPTVGMWQQGHSMTYSTKSEFNRTLKSIHKTKQVRFSPQYNVCIIKDDSIVMITYNSGSDRHYIRKKDRAAARLPILCPSAKQIIVANEAKRRGQHVTSLLFPALSK